MADPAPDAPTPKNGVLRLAVICITLLIALDLAGAALIRLKGYEPIVFGDLSKVGIGILGGVVLDRAISRHGGTH